VNNDRKLMKWLVLLIVLPVILAFFGGDRYRYPCQDPENWGTEQCVKPQCEVMRQCPEHIFKGNDDLIDAANKKGATTP
jgi:hypothetical protein